MEKIKILVPTDLSDLSQNALIYAACLSHHLSGEITALHLVEPSKYSSKGHYQKDLARIIEQEIQPDLNIAAKYNYLKKIRVEIRARQHSIFSEIDEFAKQGGFDFIVMGSHDASEHEDWLDRFKSSVAYQVVHHSPCPVFTIIKAPEPPTIGNIILPLDMSRGTTQKIPLAIKIADATKATLRLFSIHPDPTDDEWGALSEQLEMVAQAIGQRQIPVTFQIVQGEDLPEAVLQYSEEVNADLIIIMTRPEPQWNEIFVTPGARKIITHAQIPVLSVRPNERVTIGL